MRVQGIDHIGVAVQSVDSALELYSGVMDLRVKKVEILEDRRLKVAFLEIGEISFELLEPLEGEEVVSKFLEKRGEGLHHVALLVDNLEECVKYLHAKGLRTLGTQPQKGAEGKRIMFLHPKDTHGVLLELVERMKGGETGEIHE